MSFSGWVGVDLDGTLAEYGGQVNFYSIGSPLPPMVNRVRRWIDEGVEVRIFTARACIPEQIPLVEEWSLQHIGVKLKVTNEKDFSMIELYDDRCIQVKFNTGNLMYPEQEKYDGHT